MQPKQQKMRMVMKSTTNIAFRIKLTPQKVNYIWQYNGFQGIIGQFRMLLKSYRRSQNELRLVITIAYTLPMWVFVKQRVDV